ncbi:MAG: hypothetical protein KUG70_14630 [Rhodobacteraceae bacterium]|uniref:hypothetical protein n=1 Tax=unclassified Sulfitobacter TaxID=196795 RepID=UPI0023E28FEB|nr:MULTISPECIES: hypothetical protein [unclassified Sulfitobacter]MBV1897694.1 hypothetical protein [Paracoccaceae bacterium]MDF3416445.1 hypothetical protein [Sulfitobacter sp. KE5]MDF3423925.1 hypothetical protein [Sulfitobacter sp. KE43]MDF3434991.1 hypothetical protein [Sulfitobacter sp. KE42]MDF3460630.1 hypothetical protein [Sulfitobacter sp. S74]
MAANTFGKMTLRKWMALAVVLAVIAFTLLTQFTSFQVPGSVTQGKPEPTVHPGIQLQGSTESRNNLDEVNDIVRGKNQNGQSEGTANEN